MADPLCYFGCPGRLNRTLLDLPNHPAPRLCEQHSQDWGIYRAALIAQSNTLDWPADFYPFERKMREQMEKEAQASQAAESRPPGTEIMAKEAAIGFWYEVPSGEIERCVAVRDRGRGVQVGFASIFDPGADPEDTRWLQGKTSILVADEIEVAKIARRLREGLTGRPPEIVYEFCPRNGLLCSVCEAPQREMPNGACCENGHGEAPGRHARDVANTLGAEGQTQEAQAVLESVPESARVDIVKPEAAVFGFGAGLTFGASVSEDPNLQARGHGMTLREIAESLPQVSNPTLDSLRATEAAERRDDDRLREGLAGLAAREAGALAVESAPRSAEAQAALYAGEARGTQNREMTPEESVSYLAALDRISNPVPTPRHLPFTLPVYHKSLHIDWRTPKALFDSQVRRWGPFWLDAAATAENKLAEYHLGPGADIEDALSVDWLPTPEIAQAFGENIWLNHPYSKREPVCAPDCAKPKCAERGYHLERPIASSGDWMMYARDQVLLKGARRVVCLTKAAVETGWWRDAVRIQPPEAGLFLEGACDPRGGPAAEFMDKNYPAATWFEFTWENLIVDVVEIEGRVDFDRGGDDGSAGFPSAIVTFYRP